ncbi:hypothetical protein BH11BAC6_BH11BAC6_07820 [soil metagenome]
MGFFFQRLAVIILLLCCKDNVAFAQTKIVDSLRNVLYSTATDTKKLSLLFLLCDEANSLNTDSLYVYYALAHQLAVKENNSTGIIQSDLYKATYFSKRGEVDSAKAVIDKSIIQLQSDAQLPLKFRFLVLKSNVLIRQDKQKESMANSLQLLHAAEVAGDSLVKIRATISIGWAYMELEQERDALNWFFKAVGYEKNIPEKKRQPFLYSNIAAVYDNLHKTDSAAIFVKKAVAIATQKADLNALANALFISAGLYVEQGDNVKAQRTLEQGLTIREKIGDPFYIVSDIFQLGNFYANNNETDKGIKVVREGIAIAEKYNMLEKLPILYSALAENYKAANNLLQYSQALDTLINLKDSLYQKNSAEALAEIQTKYEVQKKENTIIQQQYDLTKKSFFIYSIGGLLAATLLFGFFFFKNRKKTQYLKLQAMELEQKKKTTQAILHAEEEERKRIAGDLHDSVAQKMVVAKLNLEAFANHLNQMDEPQQKIYDNINLLLAESTSEVRNLSHSMMPQAFSRSGLTTAVKDFLDTIEQPQLQINFSAEGDFSDVKENKALMIYRIIQECVQNALKHAQATQMDVSMIAANNEADVIIEDNGVGFNAGAPGIAESSGMKNIRSRVEYLSGKLDINSQPGNGTVIAFYIPLNHS